MAFTLQQWLFRNAFIRGYLAWNLKAVWPDWPILKCRGDILSEPHLLTIFSGLNWARTKVTTFTICRWSFSDGFYYTLNVLWYLFFHHLDQCDQIGRFNALWATFQSLWQQLFCPDRPHFWATFVKMLKSFMFLVESFLGNFYRHLATFYWSHWCRLALINCHCPKLS